VSGWRAARFERSREVRRQPPRFVDGERRSVEGGRPLDADVASVSPKKTMRKHATAIAELQGDD